MPNFALIRALATALRSGKYSQTVAVLRNNRGYCCLGVACDLVNPTKWISTNPSSEFYYGDWATSILPPDDVINQYGVDLNAIPHILHADGKWNDIVFGDAGTLSDMNDRGKSFTHIANILDFYCDIYETEHSTTA